MLQQLEHHRPSFCDDHLHWWVVQCPTCCSLYLPCWHLDDICPCWGWSLLRPPDGSPVASSRSKVLWLEVEISPSTPAPTGDSHFSQRCEFLHGLSSVCHSSVQSGPVGHDPHSSWWRGKSPGTLLQAHNWLLRLSFLSCEDSNRAVRCSFGHASIKVNWNEGRRNGLEMMMKVKCL